LGVLYQLRGNYPQSLALLEEAHDCAKRSGNTRLIGFALSGIGDLFADLEMWESARKIYLQAFAIAQKIDERFLLLYLQLVMVRLSSAREKWNQAFDHLNTASQMVLERNSTYEWALYQLAIGRYYLAQGKLKEALPPLQDAQLRFAETGQPTEEATTCFYLAFLWHALDDETAMSLLNQGLELVFKLESRHPLIVALREIKGVLAMPVIEGATREKVRRIASEVETFEQQLPALGRQLRQAASPALATLLAETPPRLLIRALGRVEVQMDGRPITTKEWQTQISRDIFFCILAHNNGLTKDEIGAIFWPDASPDNVKTRFKNAIYRLRGALGANVILFDNEIYRFNRDFDYDYDVENFMRKVAEGDSATDSQVRISAYLAASQLYQGPFLPDVEAAWVWAEREQLERIFSETVYTLAELQFEIGDYRGALRTCQRALAHDPCQEDIHRLAMRVYATQGNRAAVARQYALCQQSLREEIDVPPSPQTERLYSLLMHA
jgi:DNA-binding SARP family transcriptional activator